MLYMHFLFSILSFKFVVKHFFSQPVLKGSFFDLKRGREKEATKTQNFLFWSGVRGLCVSTMIKVLGGCLAGGNLQFGCLSHRSGQTLMLIVCDDSVNTGAEGPHHAPVGVIIQSIFFHFYNIKLYWSHFIYCPSSYDKIHFVFQ